MSRFDDQLKRGLERLRSVAGKTVTYRRGAQSVSLLAVGSQGSPLQVVESDVATNRERRDFLFAATDLVLGAVTVTPEIGDEIVEDGVTYRVGQDGVDKEWRWSDSGHSTIRVHTVRVST